MFKGFTLAVLASSVFLAGCSNDDNQSEMPAVTDERCNKEWIVENIKDEKIQKEFYGLCLRGIRTEE